MNTGAKEAAPDVDRSRKACVLLLVAAVAIGFMPLGAGGFVIGALLAWPVATWLVGLIYKRQKNKMLRYASVTLLMVLALIAAFAISVLLEKAITRKVATVATHERGTSVEQPYRLTEADVARLAADLSEDTPRKNSPNVELTRVDAGPGLTLTYHMRILLPDVVFAPMEREEMRQEAVRDACEWFLPQLKSGVVYVMSYSAIDGSRMFDLRVTINDCGIL